MNRKALITGSLIIILAFTAGACTRSASGGISEGLDAESTLPNPVSTQSQLMKEIIAGTQTAMAMPLDATEAAEGEIAEAEPTDTDEDGETEEAEEPELEETAVPLPTSTPGPAPVVELDYNQEYCESSSNCAVISNQLVCTCVVDYTKDQSVTLQVSNPFFPRGTEVRFLMGPEGVYDFDTYVVAATADYNPDSDGNFFKVKLNIPDSLRGMDTIVVRAHTENPDIFGTDYFSNQ